MNSIWSWFLGEHATREGTPQLQWANMPESWGVFVLIAAVLAIAALVFWLYTREIDTCPRPVKLCLGCLRFAVLLILVLMFLKPSIVFKQIHTIKPNIALLRDASLSFARNDEYGNRTTAEAIAAATGLSPDQVTGGQFSRAELLHRALTKPDSDLLQQLRRKGSLRVVDFSEVVSVSGLLPAVGNRETTAPAAAAKGNDEQVGAEGELPLLVANGRGTDLWQALREMLADTGRLSAVILASDGQHNGSEDPLELARKAEGLGVPIITIGVGNPARPKNLSVTDLYVRDKARPEEPFEVEALLYAEDIDVDQVQVDLLQHPLHPETGETQGDVPVESVQVELPSQGGRVRVDFQHTVNVPGKYAYTVKIAEVPNEAETQDNQRTSSPIEVVDEKVKVLLIAGAPTWEYRMLQRLLQRDQAISLSCWLQTMDPDRPQEGNEPIDELPSTIEQLGQYNVIMMIDPNPDEFDAAWIDVLKQFCRRKAGGFLYMAGPKYTTMFVTLNRLQGIRDILPVRFGNEEDIDTSQTLAATTNSRPGKMLTVGHNLDHPVMSFHNDQQENQQRWAQMPSIYWSFPTLTAKPTARVLMERGDQINVEGNQPLLVAGRYGAGNVLYMGFNGTWRWRRIGLRAQYFDRFWIQVVRYLVETRSLQGSRRGIVDPDRTDYELGDQVLLTARILNEQFEALNVPSVPALVRADDGRVQNIELKLLPGQEGQYESSFVAQKTGNFQVLVNLPGTDEESGIEPVSFRVKPPSVESRAYWLNEKLLREIAQTSGGQYLTLDQLDQLYDLMPQLDSTTEYSSPPEPLWDISSRLRYLAFLLPLLLLTVEWAVRKRFKLL